MSQDIFTNIDPNVIGGTQLAVLLNGFREAVTSGFSGTSRPPLLRAGGYWIDITKQGTPDFYWSYKIYNGTSDIEIFRINLATGKSSIGSSDSTFEVDRTSADTVGAIFKLVKERLSNQGQLLADDVVGEIQFVGSDSGGGNPIVARIKSVASDTMTPGLSGAYLAFEGTTKGTATFAEWMRLVDGKLGIGVTSPLAGMHIRSSTGLKIEKREDDSNGARLNMRKMRITGQGTTQNNDTLALIDFSTTDNAGAEAVAAEILVKATENHTAAAMGTTLDLWATPKGAASPSSRMTVGDRITLKVGTDIESYKLSSQDVAGATSIVSLDNKKAIVNFTGVVATTLRGIVPTAGPLATEVLLLHNSMTVDIVVKHEDLAAADANRIVLPSGRDVTIKPNSSLELFRSGDATTGRWKLKSGSGGGSESLSFGTLALPRVVQVNVGITAAAGHMDTAAGDQTIIVKGEGAGELPVIVDPPIQIGATVGQKMILIGGSNTDVLQLNTGASLVLNGDSWLGYLGSMIFLVSDGVKWNEGWRVG